MGPPSRPHRAIELWLVFRLAADREVDREAVAALPAARVRVLHGHAAAVGPARVLPRDPADAAVPAADLRLGLGQPYVQDVRHHALRRRERRRRWWWRRRWWRRWRRWRRWWWRRRWWRW